MPKWEEYKQKARGRGALALELFVVISTPIAAPEMVRAALPAHLTYQRDLEVSLRLVLAGPVSDDWGENMQGAGMIVYRTTDMEAARALAEADPMHSAQARSYTLRKWLINE